MTAVFNEVRAPLSVAVSLCLVSAFGIPASASARDGTPAREGLGAVEKPFASPRPDSVLGSHGYRIEVEALGRHGVFVEVTKGTALASYGVKGQVTPHGIKADFGRFGRISLRFHPNGKIKPLPEHDGCRGREPIGEYGVFRGTFQFRGEGEYTVFHTHSFPGYVYRSFRRVCPNPDDRLEVAKREGLAGSGLRVDSREGGKQIDLDVSYLELDDGTSALVTIGAKEDVGRTHIVRQYSEELEPGTFSLTERGVKPEEATLSPTAPFQGSATLTAAHGQPTTWSGTLSVALPGAPETALTGPGFHASLCRGPLGSPLGC